MTNSTDWQSENWEYKDLIVKKHKASLVLMRVLFWLSLGGYFVFGIRNSLMGHTIESMIFLPYYTLLVWYAQRRAVWHRESITLIEMEKQFNV